MNENLIAHVTTRCVGGLEAKIDPVSSQLWLDRMTDIGQDLLVVRGYDERGVSLWRPQAWQYPTPSCFDMPLTVQQVLLERFRGDVLVGADLLELWDDSTEFIDATATYTIPSGASTSIQVKDGAVYYVLDMYWFPPNPPRTTSLDGRPVGREIEAQSVFRRRGPNGAEWTLLLNSQCIEASLLPAPEGGIYLKFSHLSDPTGFRRHRPVAIHTACRLCHGC